ncbi:hypothetical protein CSUI_011341 [Cystoisospora suis]|uniref:Transmembrane protein n=1 Tax=Cystoisospora suis TaxID=483139 RepID=A0A2C6KE78_9APIC|nr:hypothetical protein CSUI_011341 [Cystoisospora suis]
MTKRPPPPLLPLPLLPLPPLPLLPLLPHFLLLLLSIFCGEFFCCRQTRQQEEEEKKKRVDLLLSFKVSLRHRSCICQRSQTLLSMHIPPPHSLLLLLSILTRSTRRGRKEESARECEREKKERKKDQERGQDRQTERERESCLSASGLEFYLSFLSFFPSLFSFFLSFFVLFIPWISCLCFFFHHDGVCLLGLFPPPFPRVYSACRRLFLFLFIFKPERRRVLAARMRKGEIERKKSP